MSDIILRWLGTGSTGSGYRIHITWMQWKQILICRCVTHTVGELNKNKLRPRIR